MPVTKVSAPGWSILLPLIPNPAPTSFSASPPLTTFSVVVGKECLVLLPPYSMLALKSVFGILKEVNLETCLLLLLTSLLNHKEIANVDALVESKSDPATPTTNAQVNQYAKSVNNLNQTDKVE